MAVDEHNKARFDAAKADIKKWGIWILVFFVVTQGIFFLLNFYDRTLGARTFEGPPIPYKQLATEKSHPFYLWGQAPREKQKWSAIKFPDVRSCLVVTERNKEKPDLRQVEWERIYTTTDADVCLFRIISSIGDINEVVNWCKSLGLKVVSIKNIDSRYAYHVFKVHKDAIRIHIDWDINSNGQKFPTWGWGRLYQELILRGLITNITWTVDKQDLRIETKYRVRLFLMS